MKTNGNDPINVTFRTKIEQPKGTEAPKVTSEKFEGLTKREHFAAMALQAFITSAHLYDSVTNEKTCAEKAVEMSDALIEALNKE